MKHGLGSLRTGAWALAVLMIPAGLAAAKHKPRGSQFAYAGGTEDLPQACRGTLELGASALTFKCFGASVSIPYSSIRVMQYRPDVSRKILKGQFKWKVKPPSRGGKKNQYFTTVYDDQGVPHAIVLKVQPDAMRPYLAEIDLKAGKRVEVKSHEEYD